MELKKLCCIFPKNKTCENCPVNKQCSYSFIFESIIDKKNEILNGRNRAVHPLLITSEEQIKEKLMSLSLI